MKKSQRLADAVEARRRALDMTPGDLAERSGLSAQALRNVRNGVVREYQERLTIPLTRALGWSPDSIDRLLAGDDPIVEADPTPAHTWDGRTPDELASLMAEVREFLTLAKQRRGDIDAMLARVELVETAALKATERMTTLMEKLDVQAEQLERIDAFVHARRKALARRPGELEP